MWSGSWIGPADLDVGLAWRRVGQQRQQGDPQGLSQPTDHVGRCLPPSPLEVRQVGLADAGLFRQCGHRQARPFPDDPQRVTVEQHVAS
jgi:hypothetical protein